MQKCPRDLFVRPTDMGQRSKKVKLQNVSNDKS